MKLKNKFSPLLLIILLSIGVFSIYSNNLIFVTDSTPTEEELNKLEVPKCPKNTLFISKKDSKGVLKTLEKEDSHQLVSHNGFLLCYREKYEQPEWVCYTLNKSKLEKNVKRENNFRVDKSIVTSSADYSDYKGSGYDKGHLVPCGDLTYSFDSMNDSFYLSNISPQNKNFNQGIWNELEKKVRKFALKFDELYIVTGPILDKKNFKKIGLNQVSVPEYYYKAILGKKQNEYSAIGFIIPNTENDKSFWNYAVTIDQIEKKTKLDLFHLLDDQIEEKIESRLNYSNWISSKQK